MNQTIYTPGSGTKYQIIKGYKRSGDPSFIDDIICNFNDLSLCESGVRKLIFIVSSDCTTLPDFVSTQDKLTMGFRRLAVRGLDRLLLDNYSTSISKIIKTNYQEAIEISDDPKWYIIQCENYKDSLNKSLNTHSFVKGREIALWERIKNSAPAWLNGNPKSYNKLKEIYITKKGKKGEERINRIEKIISPDEIWR